MTRQREAGRAYEELGAAVQHSAAPPSLMDAARQRIMRQRRASRSAGAEVAPDASSATTRAAASSGQALPDPVRQKFEPALGADLGSVRVHTGGTSEAAAESLDAKAYTVGQDIHFGAGQFDPSSQKGQRLLAHEVAHTVQQRGAAPSTQCKPRVSQAGDAAELEADQAADAMLSGERAAISSAPSDTMQREPLDGGSGDGGATQAGEGGATQAGDGGQGGDTEAPQNGEGAGPTGGDATAVALTPDEKAQADAAEAIRESVLSQALSKIDALLKSAPEDDGDGASGAPTLSGADQKTLDCFDRQLNTRGATSGFWGLARQARSLIAGNLALGRVAKVSDPASTDHAYVNGGAPPIHLGTFLRGDAVGCRNEVLVHEYFHIINLIDDYASTEASDRLRSAHFVTELAFDIATGSAGAC